MIDAQSATVPQCRSEHLGKRTVAGFGQGARVPRRLPQSWPSWLKPSGGAPTLKPGASRPYRPRRRRRQGAAHGKIVDDAVRHARRLGSVLCHRELLVRVPLQPGVERGGGRQLGVAGHDLRGPARVS